MGFWSKIVETWENGGYRDDYYHGEKESDTHIHDWYEIKDGKVNEGSVVTNEKTGEHTSNKQHVIVLYS